MEFSITHTDLVLTASQQEMIDERIALSLSRFASIVSGCELSIRESNGPNAAVIECSISVGLQSGHSISIEDNGHKLESAIAQCVQRCKRAIERHLKHKRVPRLRSASSARA
ncbi:HPF/RaiA family ribosome-associated protein [Ningiella sp. W23]|uniref:HPF/RaiA family ribosome-associated protein n=1 Tax=Ningiella sp. W23 TaxID=3023715 RepID=UPI00375723A4